MLKQTLLLGSIIILIGQTREFKWMDMNENPTLPRMYVLFSLTKIYKNASKRSEVGLSFAVSHLNTAVYALTIVMFQYVLNIQRLN